MLTTTISRAAALTAATLLFAACEQTDGATAATGSAEGTDAPVSADPDSNWVRTVTKTPEGGYLMGNPDARVKLIEFASLACPGCARFHADSMSELKGEYVASGDVSYELRTFVLNQPDYVATAIARCQTPQAFFALADAFFSNQRDWLAGFQNLQEADIERLSTMNPTDAMVEFGRMGGVAEFVRSRGIPAAKYEECVRDEDTLAEVEAIRKSGIEEYNVTGTPNFVLNGEPIDGFSWEEIKAEINAAL
ncbi:MAG: thioredoxin domain-containing protein [Pacificimonas sp.]|jgi:protein-disulfide isomerase|nr:thioredoxin domain-containing protein [Pacificimonas sp.]